MFIQDPTCNVLCNDKTVLFYVGISYPVIELISIQQELEVARAPNKCRMRPKQNYFRILSVYGGPFILTDAENAVRCNQSTTEEN